MSTRLAHRTLAAVLGTAALAPALAGCGADTEPTATVPADQQVRAAVARFGDASAKKDYAAMCRLLSARLVRNVESIGLPCEAALEKGLADVRDPTLRILSVDVEGQHATAAVRSRAANQPVSQDTIDLVLERGAWRIDSLGGGADRSTTTTTPTLPTTTIRPGSTATQTTRTQTTKTATTPGRKRSRTQTTTTPSRKQSRTQTTTTAGGKQRSRTRTTSTQRGGG